VSKTLGNGRKNETTAVAAIEWQKNLLGMINSATGWIIEARFERVTKRDGEVPRSHSIVTGDTEAALPLTFGLVCFLFQSHHVTSADNLTVH